MRIGVFSVPYQSYPFEEALDRISALGATAVEIGTGGYPGSHHCDVDHLLGSEQARSEYLEKVSSRGMIISALSCHYEPLSPDRTLADESDRVFRRTVDLAQKLGVPAVNVLSGLPGGGAKAARSDSSAR